MSEPSLHQTPKRFESTSASKSHIKTKVNKIKCALKEGLLTKL